MIIEHLKERKDDKKIAWLRTSVEATCGSLAVKVKIVCRHLRILQFNGV